MTPLQCATGRALLRWSARQLAEKAGIGVATVGRYERCETGLRKLTERAIEQAFKEPGIHFVDVPEGYAVLYPSRLEALDAEKLTARKTAKHVNGVASHCAPAMKVE